MPRFTTSFLFPDINVWVALTYEGHVHHAIARSWFASAGDSLRLFFCRFTQLGLLRLLTAVPVMGKDEVMTQAEAWGAYDRWLQDERVAFLDEPSGLDTPVSCDDAGKSFRHKRLGRLVPRSIRSRVATDPCDLRPRLSEQSETTHTA